MKYKILKFLETYGLWIFAIILIVVWISIWGKFNIEKTDFKCLSESFCKDLEMELKEFKIKNLNQIHTDKNIFIVQCKYLLMIDIYEIRTFELNSTTLKEIYPEC